MQLNIVNVNKKLQHEQKCYLNTSLALRHNETEVQCSKFQNQIQIDVKLGLLKAKTLHTVWKQVLFSHRTDLSAHRHNDKTSMIGHHQ